jgi:N utilization substance protein A
LPGVGVSLADALYESGFYSAEEIANAGLEDLMQIRGIGEEKAVKLMEAARKAAAATDAGAAAAEDEITAPEAAGQDDSTPPAAENKEQGGGLTVEGAAGEQEDAPEPVQPSDEPDPENT